jgi:sugar/nucleoside kinase (ribokinase family)
VSIGRRALAPEGSAVYVVTGQIELDGDVSLASVDGARALIVNRDEARSLTGEGDPGAASRALADLAEIAVVTLGDRGAVASARHTTQHVATAATSTGDATGAGDVFAGAFAAADLRGADLTDALEHAVAMAGRSAAGETAYEGLGPRET